MTKRPVRLPTLDCERCGYRWIPRVSRVHACPACGSVWWNVPRVRPVTPRLPRAKQRSPGGADQNHPKGLETSQTP